MEQPQPVAPPVEQVPPQTPPQETPAPKSELQAFRERKANPDAPVAPPVEVTPPAPKPPVRDVPAEHAWEDPETRDKLDMRTRGGRRVKELLGKVKSYEARVAELQAQLQTRTAPPAEPQKKPAKPTLVADPNDPKPTIADFAGEDDPYLALTEATATWAARQEARALDQTRTAADRANQEQKSLEDAQAAWDSKLPEVRQRYPDFDAAQDALYAALAPYGRKAYRYLVQQLLSPKYEHGHALARYLGTHLDEVSRLFTLPFQEHVEQIGALKARIAETVKAAPAPVPIPPPPAPPMTPVGATGTPTTYNPSTATLAQFRAKHGVRGGEPVRRA